MGEGAPASYTVDNTQGGGGGICHLLPSHQSPLDGDTCGPAFLGALETAIPYMSEIVPIMEGVWGGVEC
jgi:hypothetical protein